MLAGPNAGIENLHQKMLCNSADLALEHGAIALAEGVGLKVVGEGVGRDG